MFVLRDFDNKGNNFERITAILENDIRNIWSKIYKPKQYEHSSPKDFFDFEYSVLPHKIFEEEKFIHDCKDLRMRFSESHEKSLFPKNGEKNTPMDGLPTFINTTWEKIKSQKELNLPDQRVMVANLRCNEIKEESLSLVEKDISSLKALSDKKMISGF